MKDAEKNRIKEIEDKKIAWRKWGSYLSDRQWGTVREDYSPHGTAWESVPFEIAQRYAYRWGEDGIGGISDEKQFVCFSIALWNHKDKILKERLFGLTGNEGNHGEDVKEMYFYEDNTPSHSYMKMTYKYPHAEFPYEKIREENNKRGKEEGEFELADTGIFEDNKYFDVSVVYAKSNPEDISIKIEVCNRGSESAEIDLIPQVWFRNTWSFGESTIHPRLEQGRGDFINLTHAHVGSYALYYEHGGEALFCDNERNGKILYNLPSKGKFFKDGLERFIVEGERDAVNPLKKGTKCGIRYSLKLAPSEAKSIFLRFVSADQVDSNSIFNRAELESVVSLKKKEADEFYSDLHFGKLSGDEALIQRQAFAGLLWCKQFYHFDVNRWLEGDPGFPDPPEDRKRGRNATWKHLYNADVISMPDAWEYPWYAAWDLAFHCIPYALIDSDFAKKQLILMTREWYMHPNGQIPAYEWAFGDVNPPVHAWATWRVFQIDRKHRGGDGDLRFLERVFHKLMINFTWWVNRKDLGGRNIFQGGFLGLDNIGVFDRSAPLPTGGHINQADGTSWMAMYALNMMRMALELAKKNSIYEDIASKFFEHFLFIAQAMTNMAEEGIGLWDDKDEFFYDVLMLPNGESEVLRLRSMVGLIPLFGVETIEPEMLERFPNFNRRMNWVLNNRPELATLVSHWDVPGKGQRRLLSLLRGHRMKKILNRMLDEAEFLSPYGIRALSKVYDKDPFTFKYGDQSVSVDYQPAESSSGMFGGNSNWRGPIWFPVNYLIIESLQKFFHYYGEDFKVEFPKGSGTFLNLEEISENLSRRLVSIFAKDSAGNRPVYGDQAGLFNKPHFDDKILFYEYFHGDSGRGVGASHQTGWTALVAKLLQPRERDS
jgi:hypothetical protein